MLIHLCIVSGCLYPVTSELKSCDRECMSCRVQNVYYLSHNRKSKCPYCRGKEKENLVIQYKSATREKQQQMGNHEKENLK